jgi:hypothetical protein
VIRRRIVLVLIAAVSAGLLAFFLTHQDIARDPAAPKDVAALGRWMAEHPADALAASALADLALDSNVEHRRDLWRASYEQAFHLSPLRTNAAAGFVRAGMFHWYELDDRDRQRVLDAAVPLMRRQRFFDRVHMSIWSLTRDFAYLRRVAPNSLSALASLNTLAVSRGLFAEYRELRQAIKQRTVADIRAARSSDAPASDLLRFLPQNPDASDAALVQAILEELHRRPFAPEQFDRRLDPIVTLALDQNLGPLQGVESLLETRVALRDVTRARVALAIDKAALASRIEITTEVLGSMEWVPYHLDRALYEARKGNAAAAESQVREAELTVRTPEVAAAKLEVARITKNAAMLASAQSELAAFAAQAIEWTNLCGHGELCDTTHTQRYVADPNATIAIPLSVAQSDETPPYVEVYVNGALAGEGPIREPRTFVLKPGAGLKQIELRLVNRITRNGVQRRVRLS